MVDERATFINHNTSPTNYVPPRFETPTMKSTGGMLNHYDRYLYGIP